MGIADNSMKWRTGSSVVGFPGAVGSPGGSCAGFPDVNQSGCVRGRAQDPDVAESGCGASWEQFWSF